MAVELQKLGSNVTVAVRWHYIQHSNIKRRMWTKTLVLVQKRMFNPKFHWMPLSTGFRNNGWKDSNKLKQIRRRGWHRICQNELWTEQYPWYRVKMEQNIPSATPNSQMYRTTTIITLVLKGVKGCVVGDIKQEDILPKLCFPNKLPNKTDIPKVEGQHTNIDKTKVYMVDIPKGQLQSQFRWVMHWFEAWCHRRLSTNQGWWTMRWVATSTAARTWTSGKIKAGLMAPAVRSPLMNTLVISNSVPASVQMLQTVRWCK